MKHKQAKKTAAPEPAGIEEAAALAHVRPEIKLGPLVLQNYTAGREVVVTQWLRNLDREADAELGQWEEALTAADRKAKKRAPSRVSLAVKVWLTIYAMTLEADALAGLLMDHKRALAGALALGERLPSRCAEEAVAIWAEIQRRIEAAEVEVVPEPGAAGAVTMGKETAPPV